MANYYHEARAHARRLKELSEENKRRAERRAELVREIKNQKRRICIEIVKAENGSGLKQCPGQCIGNSDSYT